MAILEAKDSLVFKFVAKQRSRANLDILHRFSTIIYRCCIKFKGTTVHEKLADFMEINAGSPLNVLVSDLMIFVDKIEITSKSTT